MEISRSSEPDPKVSVLSRKNSPRLLLGVVVGSALWGVAAHYVAPPHWFSLAAIITLVLLVLSPSFRFSPVVHLLSRYAIQHLAMLFRPAALPGDKAVDVDLDSYLPSELDADRPIESKKQDRLGRSSFSTQLARAI